MTGRAFVDTNVWVYAVDSADPAKQERARAVLAPSGDLDLVVSAQVLGEFYVTITRKFERRVEEADATAMLDAIRQLPVVAIDGDLVAEAAETSRAWRIAYWDALILTAARSAGCDLVLSEDLSDQGVYDGIRVENPFRPPRRVSEKPTAYHAGRGAMARWSDDELDEALARYETESAASGMTRNAVHSYWDYARRFLAWRRGEYVPRGASAGERPVPRTPVTADELAAQADAYARAVEAAGRSQQSIDTYHRHAMFFVRWLKGEFKPGRRLR
jgi:predicted nucleic acid-binding protein